MPIASSTRLNRVKGPGPLVTFLLHWALLCQQSRKSYTWCSSKAACLCAPQGLTLFYPNSAPCLVNMWCPQPTTSPSRPCQRFLKSSFNSTSNIKPFSSSGAHFIVHRDCGIVVFSLNSLEPSFLCIVLGATTSVERGAGRKWFWSPRASKPKCFSSVLLSRSVVSDSLQPHEPQHARPPCLSPTPGVHPTHVHWVSDAIQPSHPLSSPSPPALNLSQHQGLFQWVSSLHEVAKVLEFQL